MFQNPVDYIWYCYIDEDKILDEDMVENVLSADLHVCSWADCLGRHVKTHNLALTEVAAMMEMNLLDFETHDKHSDPNDFCIEMNMIVNEYDS